MNFYSPTFLIDELQCKQNIFNMLKKAQTGNCIFRPHFKTHQSAAIGGWFKACGIQKITVSSVNMAKYFAAHGWEDILIAFPFNIHEIMSLNHLASQVKIQLTVSSAITASFLAKNIKHEIGVYIKTDAGYHRTGLLPEQSNEIDEILQLCKSSALLKFKGFLAHFGDTYHVIGQKEVNTIYRRSIDQLKTLKSKYHSQFPDLLISIGDTPSCSLVEDISEADEIRPGNFVFYDLMQEQIGSCKFKEIAAIVACPVVAKHTDRNELVIYGGAVHLSKEYIRDREGKGIFGKIVELNKNGWSTPLENTYVDRISQEHGIVACSNETFNRFKIGDFIGVVPVHSCLSANLFKTYTSTSGEIISNIHNNS